MTRREVPDDDQERDHEGEAMLSRTYVVDMPGILYCEARARIKRATVQLSTLQIDLDQHERVVARADALTGLEAVEGNIDIIYSASALEPAIAEVFRDVATADVLSVASCEAYVNAVAATQLSAKECEQFDKLSPVGKWMFLPAAMGLKWRPTLGAGPLQRFSSLVSRRNRTIHPKPMKVEGIKDLRRVLKEHCGDPHTARLGLEAVGALIRDLSLEWRGSYGPNWLEEHHARQHPPCLIMGSVESGARLGRLEDNEII